jgi:hypothetical protein
MLDHVQCTTLHRTQHTCTPRLPAACTPAPPCLHTRHTDYSGLTSTQHAVQYMLLLAAPSVRGTAALPCILPAYSRLHPNVHDLASPSIPVWARI